ncbi:MAG: hypothetical protein JXA64_00665 [Candidatus Fermentibacteraceae bacterium]|nr:hypothetical protein [Candidatus Fermentibacteraceae bacterium]
MRFRISYRLLFLAAFIPMAAGQVLIDHTCADLDLVPPSWIEEVQDSIPSHYAHTSHGGQLTWGLYFIEDGNPFYSYVTGSSYLPSEAGAWCIFDGQETATYITPDLYWETGTGMNMTRAVLDHNPEIRTSMWCWCCQLDSYNESQVQAYLDSMSVLEAEYPEITFVYFTGNAQGTGSAGYNRWQRNNQIRDFCMTGGRVLFDFADLDCWWFNPSTSSWEQHTYEYGGYDIPAEHPQFYGEEYAHTTAESCLQKGKALWYMMAVIAGWQGTGIGESPQQEPCGISLRVENPCRGTASLWFSASIHSLVEVSVYSCDGRLVCVPFRGQCDGGTGRTEVTGLEPGLYLVKVSADGRSLTESMVSLGTR